MKTSEKMLFHLIWGLIEPENRRRVLIVILMMLLGAIFESIGLGMMLPLIGLMATPESIMKNEFASYWIDVIGINDPEKLFFAALGLFVFLLFVSQVYKLFLSWIQITLLNNLGNSVSNRLFEFYIRQPWPFHLGTHSSVTIQRVVKEVALLNQYGFSSFLNLIRECLMILVLIGMLIYLVPIPALISITTLAPLGWLLQQISRMRIKRWGQARQELETARLKVIQEGLSIVRELKLIGKEGNFLEKFFCYNEEIGKINRIQGFFRQISRPIFDLYAVVGMSVTIILLWISGFALNEMAPILALFAVAIIRIIPSLNQILVALHGIRYIAHTVKLINDELDKSNVLTTIEKIQLMPFNSSIELDGVEFYYPEAASPIFKDVTIKILHGSFVAFVGRTGSGKSTLIDIILGLLTPTKGQLKIDGINAQANLTGWQRHIGYVGQNIVLVDDTIRRNIALGIPDDQIDNCQVWKVLEMAQVSEFVKCLPDQIETMIGEKGAKLSGGERQRLGIARALYQEPDVLVLDEATSALDEKSQEIVMKTIKNLKGKKTIILITHRLSTIKDCDEVFNVNDKGIQKTACGGNFQ